jgi:cephalosporin-C deacetylase-like acetyl esterase
MGWTPEQRSLFFRYDRELPLETHVAAVAEDNGLRIERFSFGSTHGQRVPALLYRPEAAEVRLPVIVVGHGLGSSKDDPMMRPLFQHWAGQGLACLCIDAPFHGERSRRIVDPTALLTRPFGGRELVVQSVVDTMRAVDWIESRPDLDAGRVGYAGFSMGVVLGVQFVAQDLRVRAATFALGGAGLFHFMAGMAAAEQRADFEAVADALDPMHFAPLIAPRPVLMVNALKDKVIPAPLGHALFNGLREPKRIIWFDGGHGDVPHEHIHAMREFLEEHLRAD